MKSLNLTTLLVACFAMALPAVASAQIESEPVENPGGELPPPQDDNDPAPPAARPDGPQAGVTQQAGVGGTQAYGRAGVLELGGAIGYSGAEDYTQFRATPSIGWFFADNLQLSFLPSLRYLELGGVDSLALTAVVEPSYHLPFNDTTFAFMGVGVGASAAENPANGDMEAGLLIAPRLGMNFLVGRSGILSPYFNVEYSTSEAFSTNQGTVVAVDIAWGANVGYTVMW